MYNDNDRRVKHFLRIFSLVHSFRMYRNATALMFDDDDRNTEEEEKKKKKERTSNSMFNKKNRNSLERRKKERNKALTITFNVIDDRIYF